MRTVYRLDICDGCLDNLAHDTSHSITGKSVFSIFGNEWYDFPSNVKKDILKLVGLRRSSDLCVSWGGRWLCKKHTEEIVSGFDKYPSYECADKD